MLISHQLYAFRIVLHNLVICMKMSAMDVLHFVLNVSICHMKKEFFVLYASPINKQFFIMEIACNTNVQIIVFHARLTQPIFSSYFKIQKIIQFVLYANHNINLLMVYVNTIVTK